MHENKSNMFTVCDALKCVPAQNTPFTKLRRMTTRRVLSNFTTFVHSENYK